MMDAEDKNLIFASAVLVMLCDTKIRPEEIDSLKDVDPSTFLDRRIDRYEKMGVYTES